MAVHHTGSRIHQTETEAPEWLDNYVNAHRIAEENHEHMRKWLLKTPLVDLLRQIQSDYVEKMIDLTIVSGKNLIQSFIESATDELDPRYLVYAYTSATPFFGQLNKDLAKLGKYKTKLIAKLVTLILKYEVRYNFWLQYF
jgi:hypothetical protein